MQINAAWLRGRAPRLDEYRVHRTGFAQLSHYTATYQEWGDGPPLVVIPGLAGGIDLLAPLACRLARDFRVITYQLRGEEDCFALRRRFGLPDLVQDLNEFLQWMGLERPNVLGLSFGGVIGLQFAAQFPNRLNSLSVQGVGARFDSKLVKAVTGMVLTGYPLPTDSAFVNQFFKLLFGRGLQPPEMVDGLARQCWQTDQSVIAHRFRLVRRLDLSSHLNWIRDPVLVISAARDMVVSDQSILDLCAGIEDVKLVRMPYGGHVAFLVDPDRISREVVAFSRRCCGMESPQ